MKKSFLILILITIIAMLLLIIILDKNTTGFAVRSYSFTKAVCNKSNYCQDYEIVCENSKIAEIKTITGASIQHSENWQDPREENETKNLCE